MAIECLPDRRNLWHEIFRSASAVNMIANVSARSVILTYENTKSSKLQGIILSFPRRMMFNVVIRDQDGTNEFVRKRYRLADHGMIVDRANWPNSILRWGGNKEIAVRIMASALSTEVAAVDLELLELMG